MKRQVPTLLRIDHNTAITKQTHTDFFYHLQHAMILALHEQGILASMQYRYAEEALMQQVHPSELRRYP